MVASAEQEARAEQERILSEATAEQDRIRTEASLRSEELLTRSKEEGRALLEQVNSWMISQKIRNPDRYTAVLAPGFRA